jgi:uncharacterized membrane protein YeiH
MIGSTLQGLPVLSLLENLLTALDLASAAVFALTGALVASRKELDIVGFMWLGVVTGVGGGTVRDLLLGVPVFWVRDPTPVLVCIAAAVLGFFAAHHVSSRYRLILWLDALGLALVTMAGAAKGLDVGTGPVVAVVMGVITGTVGGILRDVLGQEPSIILRREIYVTAALLGAVVYVLLVGMGTPRVTAALLGGATVLAARSLALIYGLSLPVYRARPGRSEAELKKLDEQRRSDAATSSSDQ